MTALFDVDLKKVSQIVKRRAGLAEFALLFNGSRLGVSLRDDNAPQRVAEFTRHFLVRGLAVVVTKANLRIGLRGLEKDAPTIVRHFDEIKICPTIRLNTDRGAEVNVLLLKAVRAHLLPPVEIVRQPLFQRALEFLVFRQVNVVRNAFV